MMSSPSLYSTTSASNSIPSTLWTPPTVTPSISSPNRWLRWKSPLFLVSPFRVSRENLTAMLVAPCVGCSKGSGEVDLLVHDLEHLAHVPRGARVEAGDAPLLRPALVQVHPARLGAVVGEVDDADALALDVALIDVLEPLDELGVRRPVPLQGQRSDLLAAGAHPLMRIVGVLVGDHLVLVIEAIHLVDAADGHSLDLHAEPALLVEVTGRVLRCSLENVTAELHCHSLLLSGPPQGPCTAIRSRALPPRASPSESRLPFPPSTSRERRGSPLPGRHPLPSLACPPLRPLREITDPARLTRAMPVSQTIWPAA